MATPEQLPLGGPARRRGASTLGFYAQTSEVLLTPAGHQAAARLVRGALALSVDGSAGLRDRGDADAVLTRRAEQGR
ncbi:MAG TPA: hypothetical protein VH721_01710 [Gaiellaceae bacterium]